MLKVYGKCMEFDNKRINLLLNTMVCQLFPISQKEKLHFADLFSLRIFVRLKDLHGWKQRSNKSISVKQIQHGKIGKIKSM